MSNLEAIAAREPSERGSQKGATTGERPLVLFTITTGWAIRNLVHTGLLGAVAEFADVGVAASEPLLPFFEELKDQNKIRIAVRLPSKEPEVWRRVRHIKKAILQGRVGIRTARVKLRTQARGPLGRVGGEVIWQLWRGLAADWQIRALERLEYHSVIPGLPQLAQKPTVLINCSPFDYRDNALMRSLHQKGTPTISMILSWDNPSTKGCMHTCADIVLVWGEQMKRELIAFYPTLDQARICVAGVPQFDIYRQASPVEFTKERFLEKLAIPASRKIILFATGSARNQPTEHEVVADVADAIGSGRLGQDAHLLIRCHPDDDAQRYEALTANDRVTICPSSLNNTGNLFRWVPPADELTYLAATMKHSDVCINTASTMTLDAFACGKPVVNVVYDGKWTLPYENSVTRYYDYHHYFPIAQSGAVTLARSAEDLIAAIDDSIKNPGRLRNAREAVLNDYCWQPPQGGVDFIAKQIEKLL